MEEKSKFIINNLDQVPVAASWLKRMMGGERIIAFYGEMGVGKTTLIKALCLELGANETVTSPTFSLVNEYELKNNKSAFHFDFYRIEHIEEVYDFGYEEYFFSDDFCFIEWPEKIEALLPENCIRLWISILPDEQRLLELKPGKTDD